ncbi:MAG: polynucleotide adenylyltransferase PcnB [Planctomycetota bacterium]
MEERTTRPPGTSSSSVEAEPEPPPADTTPRRPPVILSRAEHPISRKLIDEHALKVLYRLSAAGYLAYLVGGGVRDLLLGKTPKDFDVGTDARPSRLKRIFRNCRIIGRRFRIAHVYFPDGAIVEVSTFRRGGQTAVETARGLVLRDNDYGTPEEDALRRDITINGLFYDIATFSVIDYVGGIQDLKDRIIRTIAAPDASFREDPVRMIRVQRHAARTGFEIEANTLAAVYRNREEIRTANPARLLEEFLKDLRGGAAHPFFRLMMETHLLDCLVPALAEQMREHGPDHPFWGRVAALDRKTRAGAKYTVPVLLAVFLHTVFLPDPAAWRGSRPSAPDPWRSIQSSWREISKTIRISQRDMERVAQIVISYRKLAQSVERGKLFATLAGKSYLWEALDFLEMDLEARGLSAALVEEWRKQATPPPPAEPRYRFPPFPRRRSRGERRHVGPGAPEDFGAPEGGTEGAVEAPPRRKRRSRRRSRGRRRPKA